ncbi:MAG: hypothetical protein U9Q22_01455 [Candidatus Altiarchaeota archaeon]|nr:hypothetical protein [Candidatus Altiarchaeota archaeon]
MRFDVLIVISILFTGMVNAQSGEIVKVEVDLVDATLWVSWWSAFWSGFWSIFFGPGDEVEVSDEIIFTVTVRDAGGGQRIEIWDATNSSKVLESTVTGGGEESIELACRIKDKCSIKDLKGIAIIKLMDNDEVVDEVVLPTYYENLTVRDKSSDESRSVSDPFNYTTHLILDENCEAVGGDFCDVDNIVDLPSGERVCNFSTDEYGVGYGVYVVGEYEVNPLTQFALDDWGEAYGMLVPQVICHPEGSDTYGVVDRDIWEDHGVKSPEGNLHYLLNCREYTSFNIKECKDFDYTESVVVHQIQYTELVKEFFSEEKFYGKLRELYEDRFEGMSPLEPLDDASVSDITANQAYCFKTHVRDTDECVSINNGWYSFTDMNDIRDVLAGDADYIGDARRWNCDQLMDYGLPPVCGGS